MTAVLKRVLVVDDDAEIRNMLAVVLQRHGLTVDTAADGAAAADLLRETAYAVVLVDLMMPRVNGFELLDLINGPNGRQVIAPPVVLVVTAADRATIER